MVYRSTYQPLWELHSPVRTVVIEVPLVRVIRVTVSYPAPSLCHLGKVFISFSTHSSNPLTIYSYRMNPVYHPVPSGISAVSVPSTVSPVQGSSSFLSEGRNMTVLRSPSSTPEMRPELARSTGTPSQPPYAYQIVSPPLSVPPHHPGSYASMVTTMSNANQLNARRDGSDSRHPIGRPSPIERR